MSSIFNSRAILSSDSGADPYQQDFAISQKLKDEK